MFLLRPLGHLYQQITSDGVVNASVQVLVRSRSGVQKGIFGFRHHHSHTLERRTFRQHSTDSNLSCTELIMKDFMLDMQTFAHVCIYAFLHLCTAWSMPPTVYKRTSLEYGVSRKWAEPTGNRTLCQRHREFLGIEQSNMIDRCSLLMR